MADRERSATACGTRRALLKAFGLVLAAAGLARLAAPLAVAQEADPGAPDFSAVTTKAAARKLAREGRLVEIHFFPLELGGPDEPHNVGYITPDAAYVREMVIGTFGRFVEQGTIDTLKVVPDYKGDSIVPSRLTMSGTRSGEEGSINTTIDVW